MSKIRFEANLFTIGTWTLIKLPKEASAKLSSRGMAMVEGTINGFSFKTALEPDGNGSHWFRVDKALSVGAGVKAGDTATLEIEPTKVWSRPEVPEDLQKALAKAPEAQNLWTDITPNAQWEWIRWIRGTKQPETRKKHIEIACSKLKAGERRPCCFNRSMCSEPYVSKNWRLIEPTRNMSNRV